METSIERAHGAWQPLTTRGVAAFAQATWGRLLLVQLIFALLAGVTAVGFLQMAWFPTVREAISQLPLEGEIQGGKLNWHGQSPTKLSESRCLALAIDLNHGGQARSPAHIEVEFGRETIRIFSMLGFIEGNYPKRWIIAFNRTDLMPWWGAWSPAILAAASAAVVIGLMLGWAILAALYSVPVWLESFFADRGLGLAASGRLAGAALMPGSLLLSLAIFLYSVGALDLVRLVAAAVLNLAIGWIYVLISPFSLPRQGPSAAQAKNPFAQSETQAEVRTHD